MNIKSLLGMGVLVLVTAAAFAGQATSVPVEIVINPDGSGTASGDMLSARTAANDVDLIGCGIKSFKNGYDWGFCQARDADGHFAICYVWKGNLVDVVKAIAPNSYVRFDFDEKGECTRIDLSTQSAYLPSNLTGN